MCVSYVYSRHIGEAHVIGEEIVRLNKSFEIMYIEEEVHTEVGCLVLFLFPVNHTFVYVYSYSFLFKNNLTL